jgi:hypothetical protein
MKTDLMFVPSDTLVLAEGLDVASGLEFDVPALPGPGLFVEAIRKLYLSKHCPKGTKAYDAGCGGCDKHGSCEGEAVAGARDADIASIGMKIGAPLLAREMAGRIEPLHPAPDDLVLEEKHRDFIFAQPSYLEPVRGDFVRHDATGERLLVATSRRAGAESLGAYLTRKGVRVWAERKVERMAEGEHYVSPRRLLELEQRLERGEAGTSLSLHLRLRAGVGIVVPVELPEGRAGFELPSLIALGKGQRTAQVEEVQLPQPDIKLKPGRRWRLANLASMPGQPGGLPAWVDPKDWTTQPPYPPGGKLFAVARRSGVRVPPSPGGPQAGRPVLAAGSTWFLEFNDPVRVEQSTWILAGGY